MKIFAYMILILILHNHCYSQVQIDDEQIGCSLQFKKTEKFYVPDSIHNDNTILNLVVRIHFDVDYNIKENILLMLRKRNAITNEIIFNFRLDSQSIKDKINYPEEILKYDKFLNVYFKNDVIFEFYKPIKPPKKDFYLTFYLRYTPIR